MESQGRTAWKNTVGQPLVETVMSSLKTFVGAGLKARRFDRQVAEVYARLGAMNTMTGMPKSQPTF
jgi:hypothetical protein